MKAIVFNIPDNLTEQEQQDLGRDWLLCMYYRGIKVDGVKVEFEDD